MSPSHQSHPNPEAAKVLEEAKQLAELASMLGHTADASHVLHGVALEEDIRREWAIDPKTSFSALANYFDRHPDSFLMDTVFEHRPNFIDELMAAKGHNDLPSEHLHSLFKIHSLETARKLCNRDVRYFAHCDDRLRGSSHFFILAWEHRAQGGLEFVSRTTAHGPEVFEHFVAKDLATFTEYLFCEPDGNRILSSKSIPQLIGDLSFSQLARTVIKLESEGSSIGQVLLANAARFSPTTGNKLVETLVKNSADCYLSLLNTDVRAVAPDVAISQFRPSDDMESLMRGRPERIKYVAPTVLHYNAFALAAVTKDGLTLRFVKSLNGEVPLNIQLAAVKNNIEATQYLSGSTLKRIAEIWGTLNE